MKNKLLVPLAMLAFFPLGFADYYTDCDRSCCEGAGGGRWDSSDGTCVNPVDEASYFDCSMDCEDGEFAGGSGTSAPASSCCGSAVVLIGVLAAAMFVKQ